MTETAMRKFLDIRKKWDPEGRFPNYKDISAMLKEGDTRGEELLQNTASIDIGTQAEKLLRSSTSQAGG